MNKNPLIRIKILILIAIGIPFILFLLNQYLGFNYAYYDYGLYVGLGILLILTLFAGLIPGLIASGLLILAYGLVVFYQLMMGYSQVWRLNYMWLAMIPLSSLLVGLLGRQLQQQFAVIEQMEHLSDQIVNIDELTGYGNARELLRDLDVEMARAKRHKISLTLMVVEIQYFDELMAIYGKDNSKKMYKVLSESINQATRIEDLRFRVKDNLFAIILGHTNLDNGQVVQKRIKDALEKLSIEDDSSLKRYKIDVKIGMCLYSEAITNPMDFKAAAIKELEYDV